MEKPIYFVSGLYRIVNISLSGLKFKRVSKIDTFGLTHRSPLGEDGSFFQK